MDHSDSAPESMDINEGDFIPASGTNPNLWSVSILSFNQIPNSEVKFCSSLMYRLFFPLGSRCLRFRTQFAWMSRIC